MEFNELTQEQKDRAKARKTPEEMLALAQEEGITRKGLLVTLVLVAMLNVMGGAAVAPALPAIGEAFPESSETAVSLVITLPSLAVAISGFFVGVVADRIGKARTLVASLVVFTATGLSGLFLPSLELLLAGRFVMGIGIAGIATASAALVSEHYDQAMRAKVFGWQSAASGVSVLVLETSGGFLSLLGWRAPFLVYFMGLVLLVMAVLFVREAPARRADGVPEAIPSDPGAMGAVGFVLAACFAGAFLSQTLSYLVPAKMPYLVVGFGESSALTGLFLGGFGVANIVGSLASARVQGRLPRSAIMVGCFTLLALGCLVMAMAPAVGALLAGAVCMGLGVGCITPLLMGWLSMRSTASNSGKHMGAFATACNLGQFSCSLLSGAVMALFGTHKAVFLAGMAIGLAGALLVLAFRAAIDKVD